MNRGTTVRTGVGSFDGKELVRERSHFIDAELLARFDGASTCKTGNDFFLVCLAGDAIPQDIIEYSPQKIPFVPVLQAVGIASNENALAPEGLEVKSEFLEKLA